MMKIDKATLSLTIEKCVLNARELFEEAQILQKYDHFARAYTLYHLSSEEIGKVFLIFEFLLNNQYDEINIKKFQKKFISHQSKIELSTKILKLVHFLREGDIDENTIITLTHTKESIIKFNDFKNLSLYTFIDNTSSFKPSDIISSIKEVEPISEQTEIKLLATEQVYKLLLADLDRLISLSNV